MSRTTFTSNRILPRVQRAAYETAPDWASDIINKPEKPSTGESAGHTPQAVQAVQEVKRAQGVQSNQRVVDQIIAEMAVDAPEVVRARISSGKMNFEDFIATTTVMTDTDSSALSIPTGYEKIVSQMTIDERRDPSLFQESVSGAKERISRIARDAGIDIGITGTFLTDFPSIQRFFAKMQSGGKSGALDESMQMAAEYLASKPRRVRRNHERKNNLLKKAGEELREKQARWTW